MKDKVIFIIGPTASGKSDIAVHLAKKLNTQIISCDSMQIYRNMDILSSAPSSVLRKKVKHHLVNIITPSQQYDVSKYRKEALKVVKSLHKRGKIPVFVGGTGLYFKILLDGIFLARTESKRIRAQLYKQAESQGQDKLYAKLKRVDPEAILKIHPNDLRRIVRALEVYEKTGIPISQWQKQISGMEKDYQVIAFAISRNREDLRKRIDKRLDSMFRKGLVKEVKRLKRKKLSKTANQALGIKEVSGYINGEYDLKQAKELLRKNTYYYVKKQLTWFKKDQRIKWIEVKRGEKASEIGKRIYKQI